MILCTWNIRGLNNPLKLGEIKKFIKDNKIACFALLETRVKQQNKLKIQKKFGVQWNWDTNYEHSPKGRIWLAWDPNSLFLKIVHKSTQLIHCEIKSKTRSIHIGLTVVYGLHTVEDRNLYGLSW